MIYIMSKYYIYNICIERNLKVINEFRNLEVNIRGKQPKELHVAASGELEVPGTGGPRPGFIIILSVLFYIL